MPIPLTEAFPLYAKAANLCVNLRDKELAGAADLLRFGFDVRAGNFVSLDDALNMKPHSRALAGREVINRNELLSMPQHLAKLDLGPRSFDRMHRIYRLKSFGSC